MVVDDDEDILFSVNLFLQKWPLTVDAFADPLKALDQFKDHAAESQLIVADIKMLGIDGLEMAARMLQIQPEIKIIFINAYVIDRANRKGSKFYCNNRFA